MSDYVLPLNQRRCTKRLCPEVKRASHMSSLRQDVARSDRAGETIVNYLAEVGQER